MSEVFERITVKTEVVNCDGGSGVLGHPTVFLHLGPKGNVTCPYCSRFFVMESEENQNS